VDVPLVELALEIKAAFTRQPDVEHEATWSIGAFALEELPCRTEYLDPQPNGSKEVVEGGADRRVVVDHENRRPILGHDGPPLAAGTEK
jgi:hypothetical protein